MLTKMAAKQHALACTLLAKDELTIDDKGFVLENFHEAGDSNNRKTCAHFTPTALARDFVINLGKGPVLDLCAGIGTWTLPETCRSELIAVRSCPAFLGGGFA